MTHNPNIKHILANIPLIDWIGGAMLAVFSYALLVAF